MAIKDILVHVTDDADSPARMAAAAALAETRQAHLTGLYTLWVPPMPGYVRSQLGADLIDRQRKLYLRRAADAETAFNAVADRAGIPCEWRCIEGQRAEVLVVNTHYSDLLVMGQHDVDSWDSGPGLVESVVLGSAKPVLVLPEAGAPGGVGRHVMVAWNASREAVRAVDAALPLLTGAERVDVIAVDPRAGSEDRHGPVPGMDLCAHLARHGVHATAEAMDSGGHGVAEALLARATADGADLLVMGAYGHARWREVVLGGATAHVLRHAKVPLLMAH